MKDLNLENDQKALDYFGRSFLKIPWRIVRQMLSDDPSERLLGQLHVALFGLCYHTRGFVMLGDRRVPCDQGEFIGTYRRLAHLSGIKEGTLPRLLYRLKELHLIEMSTLKGGTRIRLCGYKEFMALNPMDAAARSAAQSCKAKTLAKQMADREAMLGRSMADLDEMNPLNRCEDGE